MPSDRFRDGDIVSIPGNQRSFSSQIALHGMAGNVARRQNERRKAAYQGESGDRIKGHSSPSLFYFLDASPISI